jgi:hypothetical protein
MRLDASKTIDM